MSKIIFLIVFLIFGGSAVAQEKIICSYLGYLKNDASGGQVLVDFEVKGNSAIDLKWNEIYSVLQNNKYGLVLARTFSEYNEYLKRPSVGGYFFAIDRTTGAMVRNNVFSNDGDAYRKGTCIFR